MTMESLPVEVQNPLRSCPPALGASGLNETLVEILKAECRDVLSETLRSVFGPVAEMEMIAKKEFLTEREVGILFSISAPTLRSDRCRNRGPRYIKEGRKVLYPKKEVVEHYLSGLIKIRK